MRQRFEQQNTLGTIAIADVRLPLGSRDELPAVLRGLQYIFITPDLNDKIFELLEKKINSKNNSTGRPGMDLWHILVLSTIRHATNTNWDTLQLWANYHELVRQIMGVHNPVFKESDRIEFNHQTILDNVSLIDEDLLVQINLLVVKVGHAIFKKKEDEKKITQKANEVNISQNCQASTPKEGEANTPKDSNAQKDKIVLRLKSDSFVVETHVHFPTDLNLLDDSMRKSLDMILKLHNRVKMEPAVKLAGWREIKSWRKTFHNLFRSTNNTVYKGKSEEKKIAIVKKYISVALDLNTRCQAIVNNPPVIAGALDFVQKTIASLKIYCEYVGKFCGQIERRLIKKEVIPADEKVFSIFETYTEWISKGKQNKKVELGVLLQVTTDQYHFIVDYKVMEKERDQAQVGGIVKRMKENYPEVKIHSLSLDRGYSSKPNDKIINESDIDKNILAKKGRLNKKDKERESDPEYIRLRRQHSAVESNINRLEHHGLNRCMDKGIDGFKRYVGLSVLAYNLHTLGNELLEQDRKKEEQRQKRQKYYRETLANAA
jgi:hypothetical protein